MTHINWEGIAGSSKRRVGDSRDLRLIREIMNKPIEDGVCYDRDTSISSDGLSIVPYPKKVIIAEAADSTLKRLSKLTDRFSKLAIQRVDKEYFEKVFAEIEDERSKRDSAKNS